MQSVGMDLSWGQPDISKIADAYGMPSEIVDGGDPLAVAEAARVAIERARSGGGPTFLEVKLIRWGPHYANEPDGLGYRDFTAIQEAREHDDPIINLENTLKDWGILTQADVDRVQREAVEEMDDAIRFAEESPSPTIEEAYTDIAIYA
jgi:pyruvate dehydrogenase E1 component alpha subunit